MKIIRTKVRKTEKEKEKLLGIIHHGMRESKLTLEKSF